MLLVAYPGVSYRVAVRANFAGNFMLKCAPAAARAPSRACAARAPRCLRRLPRLALRDVRDVRDFAGFCGILRDFAGFLGFCGILRDMRGFQPAFCSRSALDGPAPD